MTTCPRPDTIATKPAVLIRDGIKPQPDDEEQERDSDLPKDFDEFRFAGHDAQPGRTNHNTHADKGDDHRLTQERRQDGGNRRDAQYQDKVVEGSALFQRICLRWTQRRESEGRNRDP